MSKFNEEQAQAEVINTLREIRSAVDHAIQVAEAGPVFEVKPDEPNYLKEVEISLESGYLLGDWYVTRVQRK